MYYDEKLINGILHCRHSPRGKWIPLSLEKLSERVLKAESTLRTWKEQEESRNYLRDSEMAIGLF